MPVFMINIHNHFFKITKNNNQFFFSSFFILCFIINFIFLSVKEIPCINLQNGRILSRFFYMQEGCNHSICALFIFYYRRKNSRLTIRYLYFNALHILYFKTSSAFQKNGDFKYVYVCIPFLEIT